MARKPVPVPRVIPFQPPLPFLPVPQRVPDRLKEAACSPARLEQLDRIAAKLYRLAQFGPYAAGILEHHLNRLLREVDHAA